MKLFQWEISTKKFIAILSTAVVLLASGITIPIVAINSGKDKGNTPTPHTHVPTKIEYVAPDCDTAGNNQYYFCDGCDKYFKDEECKTETTVSAEQIEKTGHTGGEAACGEKAVCMNCGEPYGEVGEHSYGEASYAWSTENTICTATRVCSKDESHVETENGVQYTAPRRESEQVSLDAIGEGEVLDALRRCQPDTLTPIEAMSLLYELKKKLS